jgi:hypothetical protein
MKFPDPVPGFGITWARHNYPMTDGSFSEVELLSETDAKARLPYA